MTSSSTLSRTTFLTMLILTNITLLVLSAVAVHGQTGLGFQAAAMCVSIVTLFPIIVWLYRRCTHWDEAGNAGNVILFGVCGLLGVALVTLLTVHAQQDHGEGLCNDFAHMAVPCIPAYVELVTAYSSVFFALAGVIVSKFTGPVKVTPRYTVTKAPSSHFAARMHEVDG